MSLYLTADRSGLLALPSLCGGERRAGGMGSRPPGLVATKLTHPEVLDVSEPTAAACCHDHSAHCRLGDLLVGLAGLHVLAVQREEDAALLRVVVESTRTLMACPACGFVVGSHGCREHASISGIARQLGTTWNTVWTSI